jgi:hypothetical protein
MSDLETNQKIDDLRHDLAEKLGELHRRAVHTKQVLSPSTYWNNSWIRLGIGAAVGFALGSYRRGAARTHEGLVHSIVRAGLGAAVTSVVTRALATKGDP